MNENFEIFKATIKGKKVAVAGLGISNMPAVEFLSSLGANVYAFDKRESLTPEEFKFLEPLCEDIVLGENYLNDFDGFDIILKSPGIPPYAGNIQRAVEKGACLTSEMEIFMSLCPCKIIAVTGSDGKTTTTTLIYEMLKNTKAKVFLGGNIGKPLLNEIELISPEDYVVLELSSFQLQTMKISPDVAVITNLSPNHLDYHKGGMDEYIEAKTNIYNFQNEDGILVLNADNATTASLIGTQKGKLLTFSAKKEIKDGAYFMANQIYANGEFIMNSSDIRIKGMHNVENYLAAICAVNGLVSKQKILSVAREFGGVKHRMQYVKTIDGVDFYNDSIGSSPSRTIAGLEAHEGKIVLIAGGYDKKIPFDTLGCAVNKYVDSVVLCGATSQKIKDSILNAPNYRKQVKIFEESEFENAVKTAFSVAKSQSMGQRISVILSPACASFDMFKNFEVRGDTFISIVNKLQGEGFNEQL